MSSISGIKLEKNAHLDSCSNIPKFYQERVSDQFPAFLRLGLQRCSKSCPLMTMPLCGGSIIWKHYCIYIAYQFIFLNTVKIVFFCNCLPIEWSLISINLTLKHPFLTRDTFDKPLGEEAVHEGPSWDQGILIRWQTVLPPQRRKLMNHSLFIDSTQ